MLKLIGLLLMLAFVNSIPGQAQAATDTGQRVRVHYGYKRQAVGVLESLSSESVMIRDTARNRTLLIRRSEIALIERSLGKHHDFFGNLFVTVVASSFIMGTLSAITYSPCDGGSGECFLAPDSREGEFMIGLSAGALLGIPLGFFVGAIRLTERWTPLIPSSENRYALRISPIVGSRIGVMATLRFDVSASRRSAQ